MPVIGTAGHVDHGKSTLIERLTGRDPDRWAEEKERGLTIDLGFGWATLADQEVSFVDVPGHERYLKNMLAGIEAIDIALFVVAADEGWMPQSEEHLAVLDLLQVSRGAVALTKTDSVDEDLIELATLEVEERLAGTSLEGVAIMPVSAKNGEGISDLTEHLGHLVTLVSPFSLDRPRLWIDRAFSASGAGTVVTGTLLDGWLESGQRVEILPGETLGRIRGIQSHESSLDRVGPGRRVALNLSGIDREEAGRGNLLVAPGQWDSSNRFAVSLRYARYVEDFDQRGAYQIHIGSSSQPIDIIGLEDGIAVIKSQRPIPMAVGDRFIIRDTGRKLVVAGGRVLDPRPASTRRAIKDSVRINPAAPRDEVADQLLELRRTEDVAILAAHSKGGSPTNSLIAGTTQITKGRFEELSEKAVAMVSDEHSKHPLRVGLPLATLAGKLSIETELAELILESSPRLERLGPDVALAGRVVEIDEALEEKWSQAKQTLSAGLDVPSDSDLGLSVEHLHLRIRQGELVRVGDGLVYLPEQIEAIEQILASLPEQFTVADFRDQAGLSRKYAVPILEWTDVRGLTVRRGDTRTIR